MSGILVRQKNIKNKTLSLHWEKGRGFVVREDGLLVNRYGVDEKKARKLFSAKIWREKNTRRRRR